MTTDSIAVPHNNLPSELTSFIGRGSEMAELKRLVMESRLVSITGIGAFNTLRAWGYSTSYADLVRAHRDQVKECRAFCPSYLRRRKVLCA